jgi:hypothetical protein
MEIEIRPLRPDDDRSSFLSGDVELDRFFRKYAGQNQFRLHVGVTYVASSAGRVVGYVTIAPGSMVINHLPRRERQQLPAYPLPGLRLARLAVAASDVSADRVDSRSRPRACAEALGFPSARRAAVMVGFGSRRQSPHLGKVPDSLLLVAGTFWPNAVRRGASRQHAPRPA